MSEEGPATKCRCGADFVVLSQYVLASGKTAHNYWCRFCDQIPGHDHLGRGCDPKCRWCREQGG